MATVACYAFLRPPYHALPVPSFPRNHSGDRKDKWLGNDYHRLIASSDCCFILGYGFVFCLRLIVQQ
jgi:hypothetical protein